MNLLTRTDYAAALRLLAHAEMQSHDVAAFATGVGRALNGYIPADCTVLSRCDLHTGGCQRLGVPGSGMPSGAFVLAVPLYQEEGVSASFFVGRCGACFQAHELARLALLRPHLAFLCRHAGPSVPAAWGGAEPAGLTARERDVLQWLACGKTDADIAALLCISPRTVHKHLEHIYVKLGVETRTAAVVRMWPAMAGACAARGLRAPSPERPLTFT